MMPQNVLSTSPQYASFLPPDDIEPSAVLDYELGGIALRNPSQGLQVQVWTFKLIPVTGSVTASSQATGEILLFTQSGTTEISATFDQNMNPCVAFLQNGVMTLWWYDPVTHGQIFTTFPGTYTSPRVSMDDKRTRETQQGLNDIIFAYLNGQNLCMRMQRDRWTIEYMLGEVPPKYALSRIGMNHGNRLQFQLNPV